MVDTPDIKACLQHEIDLWASLGNPCILSRFALRNGVARVGTLRPEHIPKMADKACFENATELAMKYAGELVYVEGIAVSARLGMNIHHAWCESKDGTVVDPTWLHPEECAYMGVPIPLAELHRWMVELEVYGVHDTGRGFNLPYFYEIDPDLETIVSYYLRKGPQL